MNILLVEPEQSQAMLADKILVNAGNLVVTVRDASAAFWQLIRIDFDACVIELELPDCDGLKFSGVDMLRAYKSSQGKTAMIVMIDFGEIPGIPATAAGNVRAYLRRLGVGGFVEKPVTTGQLLGEIKSAVGPSSQQLRG